MCIQVKLVMHRLEHPNTRKLQVDGEEERKEKNKKEKNTLKGNRKH